MTGKMTWWWLSFADGSRPKGGQSLGVAVVEAHNSGEAVRRAWMLGINPGGECAFADISAELVPAEENRNRLLTPAEARELVAAMDARAARANHSLP